MNSGIYNIVNTVTGKQYIGSTANLKKRLSGHKRLLVRGKHSNSHLQRSWNKYGESAFVFNIVEYVKNESELMKIEQRYLDATFPSGQLYNISQTAERHSGFKLTEVAKLKIGEAHKGRIFTEETRQKMREAWKKRSPVTDETRRKMSESQSGRHHTEESKQKIRTALSGHLISEQTRHKMGVTMRNLWQKKESPWRNRE